MPQEFPNEVRLRNLGNQEIMEELQNWWRQSLIPSLPFRKKIFGASSEKLHKRNIKVSHPVQFCLISWYCFISFVCDCRICLNKFLNSLTMPEYVLICLNMLEYTWRYLNLHDCILFFMPPLQSFVYLSTWLQTFYSEGTWNCLLF